MIEASSSGADLLFEINLQDQLTEVLGAVESLSGGSLTSLVGQSWTRLLAIEDHDLARALLKGIGTGERRGPIRVKLAVSDRSAAPRLAALSLFRGVGEEGLVAGVLSTNGVIDLPRSAPGGGLLDAEGLAQDLSELIAQTQSAGTALSLDLIDAPGFEEAIASVPAASRAKLRRAVEVCLQARSLRGASAVKLGEDRFALLSDAPNDALKSQIMEVIGGFGLDVAVSHVASPLPSEITPDQTARAIKVAMDTFIQRGAEAAAQSLDEVVQSTVLRADALRASIASRRFKIVYQPIVDLAKREVHHYEALLRLDDRSSPFEAVRLAEELDMVRRFDEVIAESAIEDLAGHWDHELQVAVNVSAVTLLSEGYVAGLLARLKARKVRPQRLLVELTETTAIADYAAAQARINQLRASGIGFCLDDVGAGSAAFDHLRLLRLDYIKLDGRLASNVTTSLRSQVVIRHLAQLGHELGAKVIAEHLETEDEVKVFRGAGVELGQGWLFGRPDVLPSEPLRMARRAGANDQWF